MAERDQRAVGLYGEHAVATRLVADAWSVYRPLVDTHYDIIATKYFCDSCKKFASPLIRDKFNKKNEKTGKMPTDLCEDCGQQELINVVRFIQVKASVGVTPKTQKWRDAGCMDCSFHVKLRHHIDPRTFYVWVALVGEFGKWTPHYYLFHHSELGKFADANARAIQKTDNENYHHFIDQDGRIRDVDGMYDKDYLNRECYDAFDKLEKTLFPQVASKVYP